jgi:Coenzyme PQQ synthesis protein D (PqqD)
MPNDSIKSEAQFSSLRLRPNLEVLSQRYDDSVILLNLGTDRFFHLNRTAARFWELLSEGHNAAQILETMSGEFDITEPQLAAEMTTLIAELRAEDLVTVVNDSH